MPSRRRTEADRPSRASGVHPDAAPDRPEAAPPDPAIVTLARGILAAPGRAHLPVSPGMAAMLAGVFFFSVMSLFVKAAGQELSSQQVVFVRAVITLALSWAAVRRAGISPWGTDRRLLVARGFVGFLGLSAFYYAYIHLPLADATVIQMTNPVFTALLAAWWLGEPIGWLQGVVTAISLSGVVIVARPGFLFDGEGTGLDPVAVLVALAGAVFSAAAYVLVRRLRATEQPMVVVFYFALLSTVCALPLAVAGWIWPTMTGWLLLLGVGVATHLGQVFLTRGLHLERAGPATGLLYLQVVFAAAWGAAFFNEIPDAATIAGGALIVGGALLLSLRRTDATASRDE